MGSMGRIIRKISTIVTTESVLVVLSSLFSPLTARRKAMMRKINSSIPNAKENMETIPHNPNFL